MENYICINGKKAELTEEQMKALGIELPKANPFARTKPYEIFYYIDTLGNVDYSHDGGSCAAGSCDDKRFDAANYCTDKSIMEQRALHETLNRLLWRYSMEHDGDKIDWSSGVKQRKYNILYDDDQHKFEASWIYSIRNIGAVYFISQQVAEDAIKEVIKPFMKAHPEFKF